MIRIKRSCNYRRIYENLTARIGMQPTPNKSFFSQKFVAVKRGLFILGLSCIASIGYALDSDQHQPLSISSNTADLNSQSGIGIYTGNVVIDQGTTHVRGDKVTSYSEKNKITLVVVEGNKKQQARYENTVDPNKPPLIAIADTIKFYPDKNYAILLGHAYVQQGENSIAGEHLEYDITNKILKSLNTASNKAIRTHIVIDPNNLPTVDQTS